MHRRSTSSRRMVTRPPCRRIRPLFDHPSESAVDELLRHTSSDVQRGRVQQRVIESANVADEHCPDGRSGSSQVPAALRGPSARADMPVASRLLRSPLLRVALPRHGGVGVAGGAARSMVARWCRGRARRAQQVLPGDPRRRPDRGVPAPAGLVPTQDPPGHRRGGDPAGARTGRLDRLHGAPVRPTAGSSTPRAPGSTISRHPGRWCKWPSRTSPSGTT